VRRFSSCDKPAARNPGTETDEYDPSHVKDILDTSVGVATTDVILDFMVADKTLLSPPATVPFEGTSLK
jgi:hypothetical protein